MSVGRTSLVAVVRAFTTTLWLQLTRDRMVLFVTILLPILIIVIVGSAYGGQSRLELGLVGARSDVLTRLIDEIERTDGLEVTQYADIEELRQAIRRYDVSGGIVVPADADARLVAGEVVELGFVADETSPDGFAGRSVAEGVVNRVGGPLAVAAFASDATATPLGEALVVSDALSEGGATVTIETERVGTSTNEADSRFSATAAQNLVLFSFISSLTSAGLIVMARRQGVLRRALATPAGTWSIVVGLGAGWFLLSAAQGALIMVVGAVAFGVQWGDPFAAAALLMVFAAVGCGAGLLVGALFTRDDQVSSITPPLGIALGALGGCMVPSEVFPPVMLSISKVTPHYWALQGWKTTIFDAGGLSDVGAELGVLVVYAVVLVGGSAVLLRRRLAG